MRQIQIELHCHTIYSKDSLVTPTQLIQACKEKNIEKIAITDHNSIRGAMEAKIMDPDRIIIGEEIMTTKGEILAFFLSEEIPSGLEPEEVIHLLRNQNAFISISHPFDYVRRGSWELSDLEKIAPTVDAIETFNARCYSMESNRKAVDFARKWNLTGTSGADAHSTRELGQAKMFMDSFSDRDGFSSSIHGSITRGTLSPGWVHFISRWAVWLKKSGFVDEPIKGD